MTNNAYRLGIAAAGLSLFWAGSAQAVAPVVSDIPDVVISDSEDNIGGTDNNYFVFTNAFTFDNYVSDADTPVNTLKWSFDEGTDVSGDATTRYFNINAKQSVAVGDAAIATAQSNPASRLSPALANDIRTSPTASFRDVVLTPGSGPLTSAFANAAANIRDRHAAGKVVRLYVSDSTFVVSNDILVSAVDSNTTSSVDALSGGFSVQKTDAFASSAGWGILGQSGANFTASIGTRQHNPSSTALEATVANSTRARIIGWLEDEATDVPYSSIGTRFVRAKYSVFYTGPGDSLSNTLANQVPNFRLSLRTKGVVNTILEINSNAQLDGSPAQMPVTREIGPSKNAAQPSIYRVDLDPIDVPFLTGSTTEGVQRGFETLVGGAYPFATGTISVTDSSLGTYPALNLGSTPVKTYAAGGTANAADFDNASITVARLGYSVSEIFRYLTGSPTASDYFNPSILTFTVNTEANSSITRSPSGIVVNTAGLANTRIAVMDASFGGGVFGDTDATRLRAEADRIYVVSARIQHGAASSTTPYTRFNVRTLGFGYNASLDLLGGRGIASAEGLAACAQVMPGTGTAVPGSGVSGSVYNLILNSPLNGQIRNDVAGTLATKFPNATAQPGPGVNSASLRDINIGFTVVDSLSLTGATTVDAAEVASNLTLNRVEIRSFPQFND